MWQHFIYNEIRGSPQAKEKLDQAVAILSLKYLNGSKACEFKKTQKNIPC